MKASTKQRRWVQGRHFIEFAVVQVLIALILSTGSTAGIAAAQEEAGELTEELYISVELTASGSFQPELDGISCDMEGNVYATNLGGPGIIGVVDPAGNTSTFAELPEFCVASGIQYHRGGFLLAGIALSPDDRILYVNEFIEGIIWAYDLSPQGEISNKRQLVDFPDYDGLDGMVCDVAGNLYVIRNQQGTVVKVSPSGEVLLEVELKGRQPASPLAGGTAAAAT